MKVLAFGTYDVRSHPRVGVLVDGLREHGVAVAELNAPLGLSTADRVGMLQHPSRLPRLLGRLVGRWAHLVRGSSRHRGHRAPDAVLVGYLGHFDVLLARILFPRAVVVLDLLIFGADTAADRGTAPGLRTRLLAGLDRLAIAAADVVVVDTAEHGAMVGERRAGDVVVAAVGAPPAWFAARRATVGGPGTPGTPVSVVFFGLFTPLQGAPTIGRALRLLHDRGVAVRCTLVGGGQDAEEVRRLVAGLPEVTWHSWVESEELPALVAAHDVCLGIVGVTGKARRVVPNKVFQGAAAGAAVVTSDTPPQRRVLGDAAVLVPPGDAEALADAVARLAAVPEALAGLRTAAAALADRDFTPAAVTRPLVDELHLRRRGPRRGRRRSGRE